jgi:hypothetical protein
MRATREQQEAIDRMAYDMYVDCHLNATAAAYQMGCSRQAIKDRVRRHALRLTVERKVERRDGAA